MVEPNGFQGAAREAVQPSLWDRLVNDLPGVASEIDSLRQALARELGTGRLETLLAGGARALEADTELKTVQKERLARLLQREQRRAEIEARGIVVSNRVLREAVRRDIEALFNSERFESTPLRTAREAEARPDDPPPLAEFPEVRRSVVNYGMPAFAGRSSRDFDREALAREIRSILAVFEPRLKEEATKVTVSFGDKNAGLKIEIETVLIMAPAPERLSLRTTINLDNGVAQTDFKGA